MEKMKYENGVYYCPECGSRKILEIQQHMIFKAYSLNDGGLVNFLEKDKLIGLREIAFCIDNSQFIGVLCYECADCNWKYYSCLED